MPPYDQRREPPHPSSSEDDDRLPLSEREILARVDSRSMEMLQGLGRLTGEVSSNTRRIEKVEDRMRRRELRDAQLAVDIKAIKEALRKEGKSVEELKVELKDFTEDAEDSKRFMLEVKKSKRARIKIFWAVLIGAATALGTFAAGAIWSAVTHHAPPAPVEHHAHEVEP